MGTRTAVTGGGKLLARTPVSSANTLTTTATGGQDYIHNALIQEDRENSKGTIVALRVHSESANLQHTATPVCNTQAHRSKTQSRHTQAHRSTHRHTGQKHKANLQQTGTPVKNTEPPTTLRPTNVGYCPSK